LYATNSIAVEIIQQRDAAAKVGFIVEAAGEAAIRAGDLWCDLTVPSSLRKTIHTALAG